MRKFYLILAILYLFEVTAFAAAPTLINYQGLLTDNLGNALDTTSNVTFRIFDDPSFGAPLWIELQSVTSVDGLFTVQLGTVSPITQSVIGGTDRYLEIQLGASPFSPRSQLVSAPYSIRVATVDGSGGGNISGKVNIGDNNSNSGNYAFVAGDSNLAEGNYSFAAGQKNSAVGHFSTVGGGLSNTAAQYAATVGGGNINQAFGVYSTISGGSQNNVYSPFSTIGGGSNNTVYGPYSSVFAGFANTAGNFNLDTGVFVGGGFGNSATDLYATVSGGYVNSATGDRATISGGSNNSAAGTNARIGGGAFNVSNGQASSVGGGESNSGTSNWSTVGGGVNNIVTGDYATIPGGVYNRAAGHYSLAAGTQAKAIHSGSIVLAANSFVNNDTTATSGAEQMVLRADGGIFLTNTGGAASFLPSTFITVSNGASLTTGGAWTNSSDKNSKENFSDINEQDVLKKISELDVSEWNYKKEGDEIKHIGPMAQDFYEKFGLGIDDKSISTVDASGVALAAIKALYLENQELKKRLEKLEAMIK